MCGILGAFSQNLNFSENDIDLALESISHRGPDGRGIEFSKDKKAVIGHNRLSMLDLEGGKQPFVSEDGQVIVAVNGEFYGYEEIRSSLIKEGLTFKTQSDSEIALNLYLKHGLEFTSY